MQVIKDKAWLRSRPINEPETKSGTPQAVEAQGWPLPADPRPRLGRTPPEARLNRPGVTRTHDSRTARESAKDGASRSRWPFERGIRRGWTVSEDTQGQQGGHGLRHVSPLRYPGGKTALADFLARTIESNDLSGCSYFEPFAGGAGAALCLLLRGVVSEVYLNDLDPRIFAFWKAVLDESDRFAETILHVPVNLKEWRRQSAICRRADVARRFELGFATFIPSPPSLRPSRPFDAAASATGRANAHKLGCRSACGARRSGAVLRSPRSTWCRQP